MIEIAFNNQQTLVFGLGFRIRLERYLGHCTSTEEREPNSEIIKDGVMMEADGAWLVTIPFNSLWL